MKLKLAMKLICVNVLFIFASAQLSNNNIPCEGVEVSNFAGDPDDCTKFYQCNGDSFIHGTCPTGMYYHPTEVCSFDASYCEAAAETTTVSTTLPPPTTSTATPEVTTIPTTLETSTAVSTESSSEVDVICLEADPSKPRFVKSSTNCSEFYICVNRKPMLHACMPGKYWNDEQRYCDEPRNVRCDHDLIVNPAKFCKDSSSTDASFSASPVSCGEYYICIQQIPFLMQCAPGSHWNDVAKQCMDAKDANCRIGNAIPDNYDVVCPETGEIFTAHPMYCDLFLFCQKGKASVQRCPFLTDWDPIAERCLPRDLVQCTRSHLH